MDFDNLKERVASMKDFLKANKLKLADFLKNCSDVMRENDIKEINGMELDGGRWLCSIVLVENRRNGAYMYTAATFTDEHNLETVNISENGSMEFPKGGRVLSELLPEWHNLEEGAFSAFFSKTMQAVAQKCVEDVERE